MKPPTPSTNMQLLILASFHPSLIAFIHLPISPYIFHPMKTPHANRQVIVQLTANTRASPGKAITRTLEKANTGTL